MKGRSIYFWTFITCLAQLLIATNCLGQDAATIPWTTTTKLYSTAVNDTFLVSVALPEGYDRSQEKYPVVFVTDPRFAFGTAVESARAHAIDGTIPPVVLVGIGYPGEQGFGRIMQLRSRDFSTVSDPEVPGGWPAWANEIEWGGADAFLKFIENSLIPAIEENFRVTDDRTYMGWSGGGHFGSYILFNKPSIFKRYLIVSAPFEWFHNGIAFDYEEAYAAKHDSLPAHVFMAVGTGDSESTIQSTKRMANILKSRGYKGFTLDTQVFQDKKHYSVWPIAINNGIQRLFQK
jgi:predicted alpha/beta superfamily hydrolase